MHRRAVVLGIIAMALIAVAGLQAAATVTRAETVSGGGCVDDPFEDNDTQATAVPLPGVTPAGGPSPVACPGDDDWWSIPLVAGERVQIDVFFFHESGDIDIALHDPAGGVVASSTSTTDSEKITYVAATTGTYALNVTLFADAGPTVGNIYWPQASSTGDVDCDGHVSAIDALFILQRGAGLLGALVCEGAADVNADGSVTAVDASLILQYVAGLLPSLTF